MVLEVNNFCLWADLKQGSLIIGVVSLIGNIILVALSLWGLIGGILVLQDGYFDVLRGYILAAVVVVGIRLAFVFINLIFSIVLLFGIYKDKRIFVKGYLIYSAIFLVAYIFIFIATIVVSGDALYIILDLLVIGLGAYFLVVIRSFYLRMDMEPRQRA